MSEANENNGASVHDLGRAGIASAISGHWQVIGIAAAGILGKLVCEEGELNPRTPSRYDLESHAVDHLAILAL